MPRLAVTLRIAVRTVVLLVSVVSLTACTEDVASGPELRLDPATLEVTTDDGEIADLADLRRAPHAYVGAIDEELFVAVALDDDFGAGDPHDVLVYLCDDEDIWLYLGGQIDANGEVVFDVAAGKVRGEDDLTLGEDININLTVTEDEAAGDLTIAGQDPQPFIALRPEEGTNVGFYTARTGGAGSADGSLRGLAAPTYDLSPPVQAQAQVIRVGGWIVLNPTYQVRGAITLGTAVAPVDRHLGSTTVSMN